MHTHSQDASPKGSVPLGWQDIPPQDESPWQWFGWAKDDPTWDELFEEIERQREATRSTE